MSKEFYKKIQLDADFNLKLNDSNFSKKLKELGIKEFLEKKDKNGNIVKIGMDEKVKADLKQRISTRKEIDDLDRQIRNLKDLGLNKQAKQLEKEKEKLEIGLGTKDPKWKTRLNNITGKVLKGIKDKLLNVLKSIKQFFVDQFNAAWDDLKAKAKMNSNSLFYSQADWEEKNEMGFSDAEHYAFKQLQERYGISKETYEMGGLNSKQAQLINEKMEFFRKQYEEQQKSGYFDNINKMQERMEELKTVLRDKIQKFLVDNSDEIINALTTLMNTAIKIAEFVGRIYNRFFGDPEISSYQAQKNIDNIINQSMSNSRVNNVNINNTMNASHTGMTNKQQLTQASNINYRQLKGALS